MSPPCQSEAVQVATCLSMSHTDLQKCDKALDALYTCCNAFYDEKGRGAENENCPGIKRLKLKMKQRKMGKDSICGFERGLRA